jgi:hypothetical protein
MSKAKKAMTRCHKLHNNKIRRGEQEKEEGREREREEGRQRLPPLWLVIGPYKFHGIISRLISG